MRAVIVCILVLISMAAGVRANAQDSAGAVPAVAEHAAPNYPPLARQTRISGDVRVKVTIDGEAVTNAEAVSGTRCFAKRQKTTCERGSLRRTAARRRFS
jgi:hypothetical protein